MEPFRTLAAPAEGEIREKGSRFLAVAVPVRARAEAVAFHAAQATAFREATHVVPAFVLHDGTAFSSDAGEPPGSAGPPLLQSIAGAGLADVAAVVVRWYGGTNLGIGGLIRAYSGALAAALAGAPTVAAVPAVRVAVRYPHDKTSAVLRTIASHGGSAITHTYDELVTSTFDLPRASEAGFAAQLRDATKGAVAPVVLGVAVIYG